MKEEEATMRRTSTIVALAIVLLLVTVTTALAITWGEPTEDYPYVGTLLFEQTTGFYSCTGTLLSPTVLLTAGHCTSEYGTPNFRTWVSFDPQITFEGVDPDHLIEYLDAEWITGTAIPHPDFNDFAEWPKTYDVGVVLLDTPYMLGEYGELPDIGLLESLTKGQGRKDRGFTAVGYGVQGAIPPFAMDDWARYKGSVSLIEINSAFTGDGQGAKFTNNPGKGNGSGGTCFGDSGGPVFHGDSNIVGAVVSWGITPCIGVDYQFRVDTALAQDFINQSLP
jgi:hypothetical protein